MNAQAISLAHERVKQLLADAVQNTSRGGAHNEYVFGDSVPDKMMSIMMDSGEFGRITSFEEAGVMTQNEGFVVQAKDGTVWQVTIVQGRGR